MAAGEAPRSSRAASRSLPTSTASIVRPRRCDWPEMAGMSCLALHDVGSGVLASIRYFGDYELLEEIARGGVGLFTRPDRRALTGSLR